MIASVAKFLKGVDLKGVESKMSSAPPHRHTDTQTQTQTQTQVKAQAVQTHVYVRARAGEKWFVCMCE